MVAVLVNIAGFLDGPAVHAPDRPALIVIDEVCTYGALAEATERCAAALHDSGVKPGDHVALVDWGGVLSIASTLAAAHLGAAVAPMNPLLTQSELSQLFEAADCVKTAIAGAPYRDSVAAAGGGDVLGTEALGTPGPGPERAGGGDDDALVLFTSGTTGLPKAVPISHAGVVRRVGEYRPPFDPDRAPNVSLMCVPSFHVGGLLGLILNLFSGDTTVIQPRFDAGQWLSLAQRHHVASSFLVPTMLGRILDHPEFGATDLSRLTSIAYGAAAAPVALIQRAVAALPEVSFANVFGQTETLGAYTTLTAADHHDPARAGSVGKPLPGVKVRIVDPATGEDVGPGEVGELWVDSPQNVRPGWLRTGDLARQDADGYLFPTGRISDTINRGGEKFGPVEVSDAVRTHPAVADATVAGIRDPDLGERVGVAVVARPDARAPTLEELREWCRPHLASYKLPEVLVVVDALPYNELGKLTRRAAAELIEAESAR